MGSLFDIAGCWSDELFFLSRKQSRIEKDFR